MMHICFLQFCYLIDKEKTRRTETTMNPRLEIYQSYLYYIVDKIFGLLFSRVQFDTDFKSKITSINALTTKDLHEIWTFFNRSSPSKFF